VPCTQWTALQLSTLSVVFRIRLTRPHYESTIFNDLLAHLLVGILWANQNFHNYSTIEEVIGEEEEENQRGELSPLQPSHCLCTRFIDFFVHLTSSHSPVESIIFYPLIPPPIAPLMSHFPVRDGWEVDNLSINLPLALCIFLRLASRVSRLFLKVMWSSWPNSMRMKWLVTMQRVSAAPLAGNCWWIWLTIDTETKSTAGDITRSCQGNVVLDVMRWGTLQRYVLK